MSAEQKRATARRSELNRQFIHQVALPEEFCSHENYKVIADFCRQFAPAPRTRDITVSWSNRQVQVLRLYCFTAQKDAETFAAHFDGERCDVRAVKGVWHRDGEPVMRERHGPLWLPRFFMENP